MVLNAVYKKMKLQFNIHSTPPTPDAINAERKRLKWRVPLFTMLMFSFLFCVAGMFLDLWDRYPDHHKLLEFMGAAFLSGAGLALWELIKVIAILGEINDAHSNAAKALGACAPNSTVKDYCASVIEQKRNLTMMEAQLLMDEFQTDEDIEKLGESFKKYDLGKVMPFPLSF